MNIIRTMQQGEAQWWVDMLFEPGPQKEDRVPAYPPRFPFPFRFRRPVAGSFFYLAYRNRIIGHARIDRVSQQEGTEVGTDEHWVGKGDIVRLSGPLVKMPFDLPCRGFVGVRYTNSHLHELNQNQARAVIADLGLTPRT